MIGLLVAEHVRTPVGDAIYLLRKQAGMSQRELAQRSGVERSYISMIESGQRDSPSRTILTSLAEALGLTVRELYQRAGLDWAETDAEPNGIIVPVADRDKAPVLRRLAGWSAEQLTALERMGRIAFSVPTPPPAEPAHEERPGDGGEDGPVADPETPPSG